MLPWLKPKSQTGVIIQARKPDADKEPKDSEDQGLKACAEDLISAVESKDSSRVAAALRAAFQICESEPHDEAEDTDKPSPHTYDAQNIKASE
jgi:hypothetical protein